jgi:hypothetical protein
LGFFFNAQEHLSGLPEIPDTNFIKKKHLLDITKDFSSGIRTHSAMIFVFDLH